MKSATLGYYYGPSHTILDRASIHTKREWDSLFSLVHTQERWFRCDSLSNWSKLRHAYLESRASHMVMWTLWTQVFGPLWKSLGTLRNYDGDCKENVKKAIGLMSKTATLCVHLRFFVHFFTVPAQLRREIKWLNFKFTWERERRGDEFYHLCLNSGKVPSLQLQPKFPSSK